MGVETKAKPLPNGGNGARDANGRFAKGNPGGPGNPYAKQVARIRSLIANAVSEEDLQAVIDALVAKARGGDVTAARELFDRIAGKPAAAIDPERRELEQRRLSLRDRQVEVLEDKAWFSD